MTEAPAIDVLLVEDDKTFAQAVVRAVRAKDLTLDHASDVVEATRLLSRANYKVVLLDFILGNTTALEVVETIRAMPERPASVIVVTAANASALEGIDRGVVNTVLFKPLDVEQLAAFVHIASLSAK